MPVRPGSESAGARRNWARERSLTCCSQNELA